MQHDDIEAERERLIRDVVAYAQRKGHDITLVFDAWRAGGSGPTREMHAGVMVMYSAHAQKADALIAEIITQSPKHWIVVSTDREVQAHAWGAGSTPIDSDRFAGKLWHSRGGAPEVFDDEDDEEYGASRRRGGNPRQPSRRQRATQRALDKL